MKASTRKRETLCLEGLIALLIVFACLWYNLRFSGPAYLRDEIGYLSKAALLSGHVVDGSSSYFGGYSLFLAPSFLFLHSPHAVWIGVLATNALLWGASFLLLGRILTQWADDLPMSTRYIALALAAVYPTWLTMSGYAFPTSAMAFVFLLTVATFGRRREHPIAVGRLGFCVGLLYWIHPTGLGIAIASVVAVGLLCQREKRYGAFLVHVIIVGVLIFAYKKVLHPWWNGAMTPVGYGTYEHYPAVGEVLRKLVTVHFWIDIVAMFSGQLAYLCISSFGLVSFGLADCLGRARELFRAGSSGEGYRAGTSAVFLALSVILVIGMGAALFSSTTLPTRTDYWIYGRYSDGIALPLIALGLIALQRMPWKRRLVVLGITVVGVIGAGWMIELAGGKTDSSNLVNVPAFWPQYLFSGGTFMRWMLVGSAGMVIGILLSRYVIVLMACAFFLSTSAQGKWHSDLLAGYSRPSSLVQVIRDNYAPGTCVAFDDRMPAKPKSSFATLGENLALYDDTKYVHGLSLAQLERFPLNAFYLYNFNYRRMTAEQWQAGCDGPFLTYDPLGAIEKSDAHLLGRDKATDLYLVAHSGIFKRIVVSPAVKARNDVVYANGESNECLIAGCFSMEAEGLSSLVGLRRHGVLESQGKAGFLFYGPYNPLAKGRYAVVLHGRFVNTSSAIVDVVSGVTKVTTYKEQALGADDHENGQIRFNFELPTAVTDLQIRLRIGDNDEIAIFGYDVKVEDPAVTQ